MNDLSEALGPLAVLYCWQSCLLAVGVASLTHVVKGGIDVAFGGKEARQKALWANRVVLPLTPVLLGALGAMVVPILPDALTAYLAAKGVHGVRYYISLAAYGGAVGQFADYVWHRFSGIKDDIVAKREDAAAADAADPRPVVAANSDAPVVTPPPPEQKP